MKFLLQRYSDNRKSTLGLLFYLSVHAGKEIPVFFCYTLEDEYRDEKIKGETRIPSGTYKLGIRKQDTPLTLKYRNRFDFFQHHIEILNVPNFSGIYIHVGNTDGDTAGCILLGDNVDNNRQGGGMVSNSIQAYRRFYNLYYDEIDKGINGGWEIEIRDEHKLT